jgi:hypothetical protein
MRTRPMRPWSDDDVQKLNRLLAQNMPVSRIAHRLRRSQSGVRTRMEDSACTCRQRRLPFHRCGAPSLLLQLLGSVKAGTDSTYKLGQVGEQVTGAESRAGLLHLSAG